MPATSLASVMLIVAVSTAPAPGAPASVECAFEHPGYTGTCVEQATQEEHQTPRQACEVILSCLNDARCVKTYCQATTLRGGWTLTSVKAPGDALPLELTRHAQPH